MNVIQFHIFVGVYLVLILLQSCVLAADSSNSSAAHRDEEQAYNGHLYDVFKKRLDSVFKELYNNVSESKLPESLEQASTADTSLYKELKKRLDMFNGELAVNAVAEATGKKRSTVRESLYEEYKRRTDKMSNDLALDRGKLCDRTGRDIDKAKGDAQSNDFYADYKRKLDQMTKRLSEEEQERLSRSSMVREPDKKPATKLRSNTGNRAGALKASEKRRRAAYRYGGDTLNYSIDMGSSYPAVLTKALEANTGVGLDTPKGLLNTVAQKMNMSSLDLAKQLANMSNPYDANIQVQDPKLAETLRKFIENSIRVQVAKSTNTGIPPGPTPGNSPGPTPEKKTSSSSHPSARSVPPLMPPMVMDDSLAQVLAQCAPQSVEQPVPQPTPHISSQPIAVLPPPMQQESALADKPQPCVMLQPMLCNNNNNNNNSSSSSNRNPPKNNTDEGFNARISLVLDKVLSKLENLQATRKEDNNTLVCNTQDVPCNVTGTWSAYMAGLNFDIKSGGKSETRTFGAAEKNNKLLSINATDRVPPKEHRFVDPSWKYMGSALKETGGPFFIFTQSPVDNVMATFLGYCRNCGGVDTIYGSWSILRPSKDCQDITTAVENKRDIFRRYTMDTKRKERYKDMLYDKSKFKKPDED